MNESNKPVSHTTDLDLAEELIIGRLKRYAARTADGPPDQVGLLKADKVISMIRERFSYVRSGRRLQRERGCGERSHLYEFAQWVADHSNDPAVVREARRNGAVTVDDYLGR